MLKDPISGAQVHSAQCRSFAEGPVTINLTEDVGSKQREDTDHRDVFQKKIDVSWLRDERATAWPFHSDWLWANNASVLFEKQT